MSDDTAQPVEVDAEFDDELLENYKALADQRGWSLEQMADDIESRAQSSDPRLAAVLRAQAGSKSAGHTTSRTEAPKGRRTAPKARG